jgi:hypothetical protein
MRLAGRSKAGFYPTPIHIVEKISSYFSADGSTYYRILDPCCGTGEPLEMIAGTLGIKESYGVELDCERAKLSKNRLTKVINESYAHLCTPDKGFSLLFLNPPYDSDTEYKRLEYEFLIETTGYLATGGVLVYIIPHQNLLPKTVRYLSYWYRDIQLVRFPDEDYKSFRQIIIFGIKKEKYGADSTVEETLNKIPDLPKEALPVIEKSTPRYTLPGVNGKFWFRSKYLNPADCCQEIEEYGLWKDKEIQEILFPQANEGLRPLMPLRKGHLAMLIGAGLMDNIEIEKGGRKLLIKGKTEKKVHYREIEEEQQRTTIETDYVVTNIMVLNLLNGELQTIQ